MLMLRLSTFGAVTLTRDGRPVVAEIGKKYRALLALLAVARTRCVPRDELALLLWPDSGQPANSVYTGLSKLRRALGAEDLFGPPGAARVHLNPDRISTDLWDFEDALDAGHLERAVALYRAPFCQELVPEDEQELEERLARHRSSYTRRYREALETLAGKAGARSDFSAAARWWRQLVETEPLS